METKDRTVVKVTAIKVVGMVLVALVGLYGAVFSTIANSKSDDNAVATEESTKAVLAQMNNLILPKIQADLKELAYTIKEIDKDNQAARERIARIEAMVEIFTRRLNMQAARTEQLSKPPPKPEPSVKLSAGKDMPMMKYEEILKSITEKADPAQQSK